jgi:hypothetical protein
MEGRKMLTRVVVILLLLAQSAFCQILYSNGSDNGQHAFPVNFGHVVTDSFTLENYSHIGDIDISLWAVEDLNTPLAAKWKITNGPFQETVAQGGGHLGLVTVCAINNQLMCQWEMALHINTDLPAGTYYIQVYDVETRFHTWAFWGESAGPSTSFTDLGTNSYGQLLSIPSESFVVLE